MECTYKIFDCNLEAIQNRIEKLNRKAVKLNCEPIILDIIDTDMIESEEEGIFNKVHYVALSGKPPVINNWEFIGTIEQHKAGNIIKVIPGNTFPKRYKHIGNTCEHCNTNRRRKDTYLVHNTITGEYKAVGKSCLKDFTGHSNPNAYAQFMEHLTDTNWLEEMNREAPSGNTSERNIDLLEYLAHVAYHIRNSGWTSRTVVKENENRISTADIAINGMFPFYKKDKIYPTDQDYELAEKSIEWAKNLNPENNDYLYNINIIAIDEFTTFKNTGYAASIVSSYIRHIEKEHKQTAQKEQSISEYVGEIKQRKDFTLTYLTSYSYENYYGTVWIHKFLDNNNNVFIWKTNNSLYDIEQGSNIKLKGTIKDHVEYRGEKQTHITRCKIAQ